VGREKLFFRSDRDGEFNLFAFNRATKAVTHLTSHADFPVASASAGGGRIAYEQAGYAHLLDPTTGASTRLKLGVAADLVERRPRWAKGAKVDPGREPVSLGRAGGPRVPGARS